MPKTTASTRWIWDLYPLARRTWGNHQWTDDGTPPGQRVTITRNRPRRKWPQGVVIGHVLERRVFYIPTDDDLALLRHRYPNEDPRRPSWDHIEADLTIAGCTADELRRRKAPLLLSLLRSTARAGNTQEAKHRVGRPADTDPKADQRVYNAWQTGTYIAYSALARELDMSPRAVKLAIDRHRKRRNN